MCTSSKLPKRQVSFYSSIVDSYATASHPFSQSSGSKHKRKGIDKTCVGPSSVSETTFSNPNRRRRLPPLPRKKKTLNFKARLQGDMITEHELGASVAPSEQSATAGDESRAKGSRHTEASRRSIPLTKQKPLRTTQISPSPFRVESRQFASWNPTFAASEILRDRSGNTGVHLTVYHGLIETFQSMMWSRSPWRQHLETTNNFGETPLVIAAETNRSEFVLALVKNGALPNGREDTRTTTALHRAVKLGHHRIVDALINDHGADPNVRGIDDEASPCELAKAMGDKDMMRLLKCETTAMPLARVFFYHRSRAGSLLTVSP